MKVVILLRSSGGAHSDNIAAIDGYVTAYKHIENILARVTCQSSHSSSAYSLRKSLHWLPVPVRQRVIYKTALITYKTLKTGQPVYLHDLYHYHQPARTLRSSSQLLLYQLATRINFQSKAFSIMAPAVWNSLKPPNKTWINPPTWAS